ncbi:MAG TPA: hypothetical protein VD978_11120 [Azospirillum sp.]|nr:hypothetical protein [Azospirillum sp.]
MIAFKKVLVATALVGTALSLSACQTSGGSASDRANAAADKNMYQEVQYVNGSRKGVPLVVLPGQVKSNNATFSQKFGPNNIADFAELELGKANFPVLERANLGPMLQEIEIAYNMGDRGKARKLFQLGKFKSTKYIIAFDILKAEPAAEASQGFDGRALGNIVGALGGTRQSYVAGAALGSVQTDDTAKVWIIGLRYKLLDASTTEQIATNYFEQKMEVGSNGVSVLGIRNQQAGGVTLDTLVQRLVQQAVAEIDSKYKRS